MEVNGKAFVELDTYLKKFGLKKDERTLLASANGDTSASAVVNRVMQPSGDTRQIHVVTNISPDGKVETTTRVIYPVNTL